jgi:hypothetical protein
LPLRVTLMKAICEVDAPAEAVDVTLDAEATPCDAVVC